ncbi:nicotinate-nucleotide--dimethylbenzimidazole phosphoribosyltransferase [Streptomyces sp. 135]|uniref:nicotinate-nucleotide--dimethylbenzimidazole phosphoribosyltransferase n=1 Tax=Streptomyces sp. 135 TaxID=2838850 RepID=UPI001CBAC4EE|nr:nicotinate-nucleotide--dimethylbenzimidazole phosphoribosyltransferase [Streptomyces sp. 135]
MTDTGQVPGEGLPEGAGDSVPSGPVQGMGAQQPGVPAADAYTFMDPSAPSAPADPSANPADDDDLLLMPSAQGAWSEAQAAAHGAHQGQGQAPAGQPQAAQAVHQPGPHETAGRDSGSVDLNGVRMPGATPAASHPGATRRPLHRGPSGPAVPDSSGSPVRSLADRGPAGAVTPPAQQQAAPVRHAGPPTIGPEYLDIPRDDAALPGPQLGEILPQGGAPWAPQPAQPQAPAQEQVPQPQQAAYAVPAETVVPEGTADTGISAATGISGATEVTGTPGVTEAVEADAAVAQEPQAPEAVQDQQVPGAQPAAEAAQVAPEAPQAAAEFAQGTDAPRTPEAAPSELPLPAELPEQSAPAPAAPESAPFPHAAEAGQVPAGEQPAFAEAGPAAGQPPFAVASAQPWGESAPAPHTDECGRPGFAPDTAQGAYAAAIGAQHGHAPHGGHPAEARHAAPAPHHPEQPAPQDADAPEYASLPGELGGAEAPMPIGQFVPVEGSVPTTPHLAPTPPRHLVVEQEQEQEQEHGQGQEQQAAEALPAPEAPENAQELPGADQPMAEQAPAAPAEPGVDSGTSTPVPPVVEPAEAVAVANEAAPAEAPASDESPEAVRPAVTVPAPRDGAEPTEAPPTEAAAAPDTALPQEAAGEATAEAAQPLQDAPVPAAATEAPVATASPVPPVSAVVAPAEFPAAPETADQADELDEADEVISFEPIKANEVTEVAEAPEMAEAPEAPETAEGPEILVAEDAPAAETQPVAEAPGLLVIEDETEDVDLPEDGGRPEDADRPEAAGPATSPGTAAPGYDDAEREAVLRVMRERRDIRNGFRSDPIPHEVLLRVLEAAHTAPSVGHSQPWDFVVIKSAETRRTMHELAMRQRDAYAKSLPKGRAKQFKELKIEAILDTPVNIVVTADPTRGGRHTLGRHTQPQMAPYSSALAVENLWLAARAEGLGVGWVSFFDEREMVRALGLPEHLEVVAYLCVGYVDEFPDEPELMQAGWSKRRPLSWVVHEETYGRRALPGEDPHDLLAETVSNIRPLDAKALGEAWERQKRMTKPPGALGMLEIISAQLSGLSRMCPPPIPEPAAVAIFAGDHGVHAQGVTAWPQEVTAQMVANFLGGGAVCNAFANQVGAEVCVIDVGVASELPATPGLLPRKVRAGTADMTTGPALTREEVKAALEVGIETARDLVAAGNKALLTGEMGIANTTASAALISVYTDTDPAEVTGRGTGINDDMHARKVEVVRRALELHRPDPADPIGVLAAVGGLEHAAMVGLLLGGASLRTPVILDGVSAGAAALVARAVAPEVLAACIAGHRSAEPGHVAALNKLGLRPLVDLDLRLGEGTGALLALPIVQSAARAMHEVATFDSAGVTEK